MSRTTCGASANQLGLKHSDVVAAEEFALAACPRDGMCAPLSTVSIIILGTHTCEIRKSGQFATKLQPQARDSRQNLCAGHYAWLLISLRVVAVESRRIGCLSL